MIQLFMLHILRLNVFAKKELIEWGLAKDNEFRDEIEAKLKDKHYAKLNERWANYKENSKRG